jgi:hypothetical protein
MVSRPGPSGDASASREKRLVEALRANLKRRKARQRERSAAADGQAGGSRTKSVEESG